MVNPAGEIFPGVFRLDEVDLKVVALAGAFVSILNGIEQSFRGGALIVGGMNIPFGVAAQTEKEITILFVIFNNVRCEFQQVISPEIPHPPDDVF